MPIKRFSNGTALAIAISIAMSILLVAWLTLSGNNPDNKKRDFYAPIEKVDINKSTTMLDSEIYIQKVDDLDLQSKSFAADGYIWIKWNGDLMAWDIKTKTDPADTIEFLNAVYKSDFKESLSPEEPYYNEKGLGYQAKSFSGKFLAYDIDLRRFPFETITLPIEIETDDFWISEAALMARGTKNSSVSEKNSLNGYGFERMSYSCRKHIYNTDFGLSDDAVKDFKINNASEFSNCVAELIYKRETGSTAWRLFVPLLAVLWITILSPLIDPRNLEPKVALPASVVLSLVFLQQGYRDMLPDSISYLTFMDKIYGLSYIATFLVFLEALVSTNLVLSLNEAAWLKIAPKLKAQERILHRVLIAALCIGPVFLWFTT